MQTKKLIAKSKATGLYFNGTNFSVERDAGLELRPGTTAADFSIAWGGDVEIETIILSQSSEEETKIIDAKSIRTLARNVSHKSLAERIYIGELDEYGAARAYVTEAGRRGAKSFTIRTVRGKYISRVVRVEQTGVNRVAWINFKGNQCALVWKGGELAMEWA